jgi:hypothetical protein
LVFSLFYVIINYSNLKENNMIWIKLVLVVVWFLAGVILFAKEVAGEFPVLQPLFEKLGVLGEKTVKPTSSPTVSPSAKPTVTSTPNPVTKPKVKSTAKPKAIKSDSPAKK